MNNSELRKLFKMIPTPDNVSLGKAKQLTKAGLEFAKTINKVTPKTQAQTEVINQVAVVVSNSLKIMTIDGDE